MLKYKAVEEDGPSKKGCDIVFLIVLGIVSRALSLKRFSSSIIMNFRKRGRLASVRRSPNSVSEFLILGALRQIIIVRESIGLEGCLAF